MHPLSAAVTHIVAALVAVTSIMVATVTLSLGLRRFPAWRGLARLLLLLTACQIGMFVMVGVSLQFLGLWERLFFFFLLAWKVLAAFRANSIAASG